MKQVIKGTNQYKTAIFTALFGAIFIFSASSAQSAMVSGSNPGYYAGGGYYGSSTNSNNSGNNNSNSNNNSGYYSGNNSGNNNSNNNGGNYDASNNLAIVTTESAYDLGKTSAVIQGTTYVENGNATVWFEWGSRSSKLDNTTPTVIIGTASTGSSAQLTNLASGTKYFYRIVASTNSGKSYGIVRSFTTTGGVVTSGTTNTSSNSSNSTKTTNTTKSTNTVSSSSNTYSSSNGDIKGSLSASAANSGSSNSFMPSSILGWFIVIILVFAIVLTVRKIQIENEARKKRKEEMEKAHAEQVQKLATA